MIAVHPAENDGRVSAFVAEQGWPDSPMWRAEAQRRLAPGSPTPERESFADVPRVPMCRVTVSSSWHNPVRCAYAEGHPGEHSWASLPAHPPGSPTLREALRKVEQARTLHDAVVYATDALAASDPADTKTQEA